MFKNICWSVDGTLFDTYPAITYAISKSLNELGGSLALNVIDGLVRHSLDHCLETLSQRFKLDPELIRSVAVRHYLNVPLKNQAPFPGVGDVCAFVQEHDGVNVAVTHRDIESTHLLMVTHDLAPFFADIISAEQGYPCLPDPNMVLAALKKHSLNPVETLLIGDRDLDIQAGRAAGVRTCLFGKATRPHPSDFQIEYYRQLLALLQEGNR